LPSRSPFRRPSSSISRRSGPCGTGKAALLG
jgi:hypothetical protein